MAARYVFSEKLMDFTKNLLKKGFSNLVSSLMVSPPGDTCVWSFWVQLLWGGVFILSKWPRKWMSRSSRVRNVQGEKIGVLAKSVCDAPFATQKRNCDASFNRFSDTDDGQLESRTVKHLFHVACRAFSGSYETTQVTLLHSSVSFHVTLSWPSLKSLGQR